MQFMIMRKSDLDSEAGGDCERHGELAWRRYRTQLASAGILRGGATLGASADGVRLLLTPAGEHLIPGPFPVLRELVDNFSIIEVGSRQEALDWAARWPAEDGEAELEVRETGCPGGCLTIDAPPPASGAAALRRFALLLRSDPQH